MIGRTVAGRFRIRSVIARGGMGKVYRAEQVPLGRDCAVKILNPKYDQGEDDPEFRRRFFLEASTASKLTHANTVTIFDYGEDDGIFYIAMEYVAGRTLFRVLREDGPLAEIRVAGIIGEVGRSLREAHGIGVIHRDMKPANIVLSESEADGDSVKVLDFGLVKHVEPDEGEDLTQQGLFMGSPKYMAPEQILGNAVSPATDIYALGVVAYELLTGRVPFDRGSSVKTLMAHVNDAPPPLYETNPDVAVSPEMTAVVMRCIDKDPKHRYASVDELLRDLSRVAGGGPMVESLLRIRKVSLPAEGRVTADVNLDEDTAPTRSSRAPAAMVVEGVTEGDRSVGLSEEVERFEAPPSSGVPFVGQWPSATPEPMSQALLDETELVPPSRHRVAVVLAALAVMVVSAIAFVVTDSPSGEGEQPAVEVESSESVDPMPVLRVVRVTSSPSGAQVREGKEVLCGATPCEIAFRGEEAALHHELTFRMEGHDDVVVPLAPGTEALEGRLEVTKAMEEPDEDPGAKAPPRTPSPKTVPPTKAAPSKPEKSLPGYKESPY